MTLSKIVSDLVMEEQVRQHGRFIPPVPEFLEKLSSRAELLVHEENSICRGFVFFYCNDPRKISSFVTLLLVAPESRGLGIGVSLVRYVMFLTSQRGFSFCRLEVRKDNLPALKIYASLGFYQVEDRGEKYLLEARAI